MQITFTPDEHAMFRGCLARTGLDLDKPWLPSWYGEETPVQTLTRLASKAVATESAAGHVVRKADLEQYVTREAASMLQVFLNTPGESRAVH